MNQTQHQTTSISKQLITSAIVVLVLSVAAFAVNRQAKPSPTESLPASKGDSITVSDTGKQITQIGTTPVHQEPVLASLHVTGQIIFPPDKTVKISPRLQGRVRQVFVRVGDRVVSGQTLAILDSVDAATAQTAARQNENKLRQAKNTLDRQERVYRLGTPDVTQAQAALDQARAATISAKDTLDRTKQQAIIGGFTQPPVEAAQNAVITAKNALVQAQSDLAQAQRDFDRKAKLVEIGVVAKSDLELAQNVLEKARAAVLSDQESVQLTQQALAREQKAFKSNLYAEQQVQTQEAAVRQVKLQQSAAERALSLSKATILRDVQQARSDYQAAQFDVENSRRTLELLGQPGSDGTLPVRSPISGIVTDRQVSAGQVVDQSQMTPWQMFTISNTTTVCVDADVYEKDIRHIKVGQAVRIGIAAFPGQEFRGTVRNIAPTLDPKSRSVKVRADIANMNGLLKDGMYADVTITLPNGHASLMVPIAAIQHDGDIDSVYVAEGKTYHKRRIKVGATLRDGRCVVESGLHVGDAVVTHGALFLGGQ